MFKNVAIGIIAASTIGLQVWIGHQYKKFLAELMEKETAPKPEDRDDSLYDTYETLKDLEKILDELI